jgi:hypothetical protein
MTRVNTDELINVFHEIVVTFSSKETTVAAGLSDA